MSQSSKPPAGGTVISAGSVHPSPPPLPESMQPVVASHSGRLVLDLVGTVLSQRYRVLKKLGEGGMGSVYLAEHTTINKKLAIKVLSPDFCQKPDLVDRFLQEARAASMIEQENVVEITDFGTVPGGTVFFVMEYLNGEDLAATIKREGPLPWQRVRQIILQICDALAAAHDAGIIHRDMKPENCYRIRRGSNHDFIKVLDFGIAKVNSDENEGTGRNLTRTGMIFGTPEYMSPEQAKGERVDHRVDIYAVGIILYELLTGRVPFVADTFMGTLTKHMFEAPPPPAAVAPGVHVLPEVEAIILKALQKERDYRFQSMGEMANAIRAVGTGAAPVAVVQENLAAPTSGRIRYATRDGETIVDDGDLDVPPRRSPWPIAGGLVAAALLLGGLGAYASGRWTISSTGADASGVAVVQTPTTAVPEKVDPRPDTPALPGEKPEAEAKVAAPPPEPPPAPTTVALRVETTGVEGTVYDTRDGRELGPTNAALSIPYGEDPFEIEVVAPGREPQRREIHPSADLAFTLDLPEVKAKRARKAKKAAAEPTPRHDVTPTPSPSEERPTAKTPPKKKTPTGSPDLKNPFG